MARTSLIAVRVSDDVVKSLDEVAAQRGVTRSDLMREMLENCHSFFQFVEKEKAKQQTDRITLDNNLSQWVLNNMPEDMTPEWVHFLGEVMHHVADRLVEQGKKGSIPNK